MDPVAHLIVAAAAFVVTHFVTSTPLRARLVAWLGQRVYLGLYSVVALATLSWMIWAYRHAPFEPLWNGWRYLPLLLMPLALILLVAGYLSRNPTMLMQEDKLEAAEPARGIMRVTRHPLMWAFALWALSHLLARGDVGSSILFGAFVLLALAGTVLIDRRKAALGENWRRFAAVTSNVPFLAILQGRNRLAPAEIGWRKPLIGVALFVVLLLLHSYLFGARPY